MSLFSTQRIDKNITRYNKLLQLVSKVANMEELLTTKQVQELLQVDRITIYRMLKAGRLAGVKVGNQWRFPRREIEALISGAFESDELPKPPPSEALPVHCLQVIQDVFAEILNVGSITTEPNGEPITAISNSCEFCDLILSSQSGRKACIQSWRNLARTPKGDPVFVQCHAGFQYARGRIELEGELTAILVAGQFLIKPQSSNEQAERINQLAAKHQIDPSKLEQAASTIRILDEPKQAQIGGWLKKVAQTFEDIGRERADLLERLKNIAAMSTFEGA